MRMSDFVPPDSVSPFFPPSPMSFRLSQWIVMILWLTHLARQFPPPTSLPGHDCHPRPTWNGTVPNPLNGTSPPIPPFSAEALESTLGVLLIGCTTTAMWGHQFGLYRWFSSRFRHVFNLTGYTEVRTSKRANRSQWFWLEVQLRVSRRGTFTLIIPWIGCTWNFWRVFFCSWAVKDL